MSKDHLLMFLEKRIFTLKVGDDNLLEKLRAAVDEVVGRMSDEPRLVVPFILIALDPQAPIGDPVFETVATAVQNQWNTYTEVFTEPRTVFRAVLLDGIARAAEANATVASAVDLIARNMLPHLQLGGEAEIIRKLRDRMRELAQAEAERQWPSNAEIVMPAAPTIKFGQLGSKKVSVDREAFRAGFPTPAYQNNWQTDTRLLHNMIASSGADNIAAAIESAVAASRLSAEDLKLNVTDPLLKGIHTLIEGVSSSLESAVAPVRTLRRQSDLLWWKEAGFSEHLQRGYRSIPVALLPLVSALDFCRMLPPYNPLAVEHFLAEAVWTYLALAGTKSKKVNLAGYLEKLAGESEAKGILDALPFELLETSGRSTILAFAVDVVAKRADGKQSVAKTGVPVELSLSEADIALIFFREIQALRLLSKDGGRDSE